jgi:hypothetical protein
MVDTSDSRVASARAVPLAEGTMGISRVLRAAVGGVQ